GSFLYLVLYVDDMLIDAPNKDHIRELKDQLSNEFDMKDLGAAINILGMEIRRDRKMGKLTLSQTDYISKILKKFKMSSCKPVPTLLAPHFKLSSHECPKFKEDKEDMSRVLYSSAVGNLIMPLKKTSTSEAPPMNSAAIRKLVVDSVATALETQAATMKNADNANRNPELREAPIARKFSYKELMSCQPFKFKGSEGAIGLICWSERTESVFSYSNCAEDCKVKFATGLEAVTFPLILQGNPSMKASRSFSESLWYHSIFQRLRILEEIYRTHHSLHTQMVKFVFHLLDLSLGTILFYQTLLEFNPGASLSSGFLLALSAFFMVAAYVSRAVATLSTTSFLMAAEFIGGASDVDVFMLIPPRLKQLRIWKLLLHPQNHELHVDPAKIKAVKNLETPTTPTEISLVAYKLELPEELSNVHSTFHISNINKCLSDESLVIPIKELQLDGKLNFVEEPVEIIDQEIKQLRQSRIPIVKV
nr:retrovirus-related Pol polyprotein from transposon TNT 1-94 [Tanacetum cinerariifolium]